MTVSASWQLHYLLHQSAILLLPGASWMVITRPRREAEESWGIEEEKGGKRGKWRLEGKGTREEEMVSLKQSRWLVALDRNLVYGIMSVCPRCMCPYTYIYTYIATSCARTKGPCTPKRWINFCHDRNFIKISSPVIVIRSFCVSG